MTQQDLEFFKETIKELLEMEELKQLNQFIQHGNVTCLEHSISVTYRSYHLCKKLGLNVDYRSLIRGAMLHDYFLYDWHEKNENHRWHGFHHPRRAYQNAKKVFSLNRIERDIIINHMWPLTFLHIPHYKESIVVCMVDKWISLGETFHVPMWRPRFNG